MSRAAAPHTTPRAPQAFAVDALLQTLSDFARLALPRHLLRPELDFARGNISAAIGTQEVEVVAAMLDALRSFDVSVEDDDGVAAAVTFLLRAQRPNGSWPATASAGSAQSLYHPTCVAAAALSVGDRHGFGPAVPRVLPLLREQAGLGRNDPKEEL